MNGITTYADDYCRIGSTSLNAGYGYRVFSTLQNGAMTPAVRIGAISSHFTENSSLYVDNGNIELGSGHALQFGDGTALDLHLPQQTRKQVLGDRRKR